MTEQDLVSLIEEVLEERKKKRKKKKKSSGKKDACYYKVKSRYKTWPSAYASGALVKCRKVGAKNWGNSTNEELTLDEEELLEILSEEEDETLEEKKRKLTKKPSSETSLRDWFKRKGAPGKKGGWVDCNSPKRKDGKITGYKSCGRSGKDDKRSKYPACRPTPSACKSKGKGKSWGKKSAKGMKESMDNLQQLIENEILALLNEAKPDDAEKLIRLSALHDRANHKAFFDDVESGNVKPEKKEEYDQEVDKYLKQLSGIPSGRLSWVKKMLKKDSEPLDEIISMLKAYLQNKGKFQNTKLKNLTPGDIRDRLEELGGDSDQKPSEKIPPGNDEIYNSNNWIGVYPKTEQGSVGACKKLSSGVQWCTAATKSENYFNEYTGKQNFHLYYFFKKDGNTRKNPYEAIAIGWTKKDGQTKIIHGANATVNAQNKNLSENDLQIIFGKEWKAIKQKMIKDLASEERKDTAFNKIVNSLTPETLNAQLAAIDNADQRIQTLKDLLKNETFVQNRERTHFAILKLSKMSKSLNLSRTKITTLPDDLKVGGDLDLSYTTKITTLPDNFKVGGNLYLSRTLITTLPDNLKVGGDLNLQHSKITTLPDSLEVGGNLYLHDTKITALPNNLKVGGNLKLQGTIITTLSDNLEVGGSLSLQGTKTTTLPNNLKVGRDLNLQGTKITTLPDDLKVDRDLNLQDTQITTLPNNFKVGGNLKLYDTPITTLPDNLKVGGNLKLYGTSITTLPDNFKVGGNLNLQHSKITTLPDNLEVGGDLDLSFTKITTLPDNLKVGGSLDLTGTKITTLPDSLKDSGKIIQDFNEENRKSAKGMKESMDNLQEQILSEVMQLLESTNISEGMQYHLDNQIPITETVYRPFSDAFIRLIKEARTLHSLGLYEALTEDEEELLESDLGEFGVYEGEVVPLDRPMINEEELDEAKFQGKEVKLGKPTKGDVKKYKVYVRNKKGNVIKVNYGSKDMKGNWNDPEARRSFAARHKCAEKKDRTKPGYWACRAHKHFGKNVSGAYW